MLIVYGFPGVRMYLPLQDKAEVPEFIECAKHQGVRNNGFVLYYTDQCPFTDCWVHRIEKAAKENSVSLQTLHLASKVAAQNVPAPVTAYALFQNEKFVTQAIQSEKKFLKIAGILEE